MDFTTSNGKTTYHLNVGDSLRLSGEFCGNATHYITRLPAENGETFEEKSVHLAYEKDAAKPNCMYNPEYLADDILWVI